MDHKRVAIAQVFDGTDQLRTVDVLAAGLIGEDLVQLDTIELPVGVLVYGADSLITDTLTHVAALLCSR
jgi:hypothetical protein